MNNEITGKQGITCFPLFCYGLAEKAGKVREKYGGSCFCLT